jgi:pyrophosphatase PpaX
MQKYRHILFDWDGTLAKTLDIWLVSLRNALQKRNYSFSDTEIGANYELFRKRFETEGHSGADDIINEALDVADKNILNVELYPSAVDTLEKIHNFGRKIGLVTTSTHGQIDPLLKHFGLVDLFDSVICSDDTKMQKPDPEPILKAMQILGATHDSTILIGDSQKDILAAHGAGISSMLFYPKSHEKFHDIEMLKSLDPTYVIHSLKEINKIIYLV